MSLLYAIPGNKKNLRVAPADIADSDLTHKPIGDMCTVNSTPLSRIFARNRQPTAPDNVAAAILHRAREKSCANHGDRFSEFGIGADVLCTQPARSGGQLFPQFLHPARCPSLHNPEQFHVIKQLAGEVQRRLINAPVAPARQFTDL